ncbi:hypothetical protein DEO72_LG3g889 [Vigna unguiculata]|uniref:GRF-type domain-containing protein n=1 Tax=Vigna unguiculata TaxID=3917 RepID=A0A4D6LCX6_VIGUN|nr:hypothetical protein DEO72_LG3g889 [Vigna unguiculata]
MSKGHSSSSCSCNSWGMQNPNLSSHSGGFSSHGSGFSYHDGTPTCTCGHVAMLRTTRTTKNGGRQFLGCSNYKIESETFIGCNYFKWCSEDGGDDRDDTIMRQRRKIYILEKELKRSRKNIKAAKYIIAPIFKGVA